MSRLQERIFQTVVLVGLALTAGCAPGLGAVGHSSGGGSHLHVRESHYHYHRGGGYYNGGWGNNYGNYYGNQSYYPQPGPPAGQTFSGPAHIDPSQYNNYVQTYQWPSH